MAVLTSIYYYLDIVNCVFLLTVLLISFCLLSILKMETINFKFKNTVLFLFLISYGLFMLQFTVFFYCKHSLRSVVYLDFFSYLLIFLCYIVGFVSLMALSDRFWIHNRPATLLFLYFPLIILRLARSSSLLEMFMYYELLLLPSIFFVYGTAYTRRSKQANLYFFIWTQIGSLTALIGVVYIYATLNTTDFVTLYNHKFTKFDSTLLYSLFFIGFGVKVPIWPFHFWLTKVHVEAPSGFSIFLSGFLVKSAVYCFYKFSILFYNHSYVYVFPILCIFGALDGSLKMWGQTDIKKMIAYATVQEMNAIFFLFNINDCNCLSAGYIFLFAHGILSSLMFYLVELLYKRTHSRSIYKVTGISEFYPNLSSSVWVMLILFFGLPGTIKFFAEVYILAMFLEISILAAVFFAFVFIFIGTLGFTKNWLSVLYGHPGKKQLSNDLNQEEVIVVIILFALSLLSCFFLIYI